MAKQKFERTKPHVNIGTIGHVDPDKATLISTISKYLSEHGHSDFDKPPSKDKTPENMCSKKVEVE